MREIETAMEPQTYMLRVETLEPIRCPELFEGDELVLVIDGDSVEIAELESVRH